TIVSVVTLVWGISPRQPSGKNIIRWLLKKRTNGSVRYCQYTSQEYHRNLRTLADCLNTDEWPAIKTLSLPRWAKEYAND
ncbi:hypothetical protein MMS26_27530, partial [Escherichia coli]|nr:hypothetical protein [Escherichia coli]